MKRTLCLFLAACLILALLLAGCAPAEPEENLPETVDPALPPEEPSVAEPPEEDGGSGPLPDRIQSAADVRQEIAEGYVLTFGDTLSFAEGDTVAFADVFPYFLYAGVYRLNQAYLYSLPELAECRDAAERIYTIPAETAADLIAREILTAEDFPESMKSGDVYRIPLDFFTIRRELYPYFDAETGRFAKVPAQLVDGYLTGKFPAAVDHTGLDAYDAASDTYSFAPFAGDFFYDVTLSGSLPAQDEACAFTALVTLSQDVHPSPPTGYQLSFQLLLENGEYRFLSVEAVPLAPWDVCGAQEDFGSLAELLAGRAGEAPADGELIRAVYGYQRQTVRQGYEWSLLPAFSADSPPDWDDLSLYGFMLCEDTGVDGAGYSTMTADAFDAVMERYLPGVSCTHRDSAYFTYADGVYTSTGWGDVGGAFLLPLSLACRGDGVYTLSLAGFQFSEWDFLPGESDPSPLMAAILDAAGGRRPPSPHRALLSLYLDESTRDSLPVSSQVTITLRLTGDEAHPFQYLSCQRSSSLPSQS